MTVNWGWVFGAALVIGCGTTANNQTANGGSGKASGPFADNEADAPWGIWAMTVQYGPPGEAITPTIPMQVDLRPDGTAYRWTCTGAPDDGSVTSPCDPPVRGDCYVGTVAWTGSKWNVALPKNQFGGLDNQGDISAGENGTILISYINPSASGALFRRVGEPGTGGPGCTP